MFSIYPLSSLVIFFKIQKELTEFMVRMNEFIANEDSGLPLQCGKAELHSPSWQLIEEFPTKVYPRLHKKMTLL